MASGATAAGVSGQDQAGQQPSGGQDRVAPPFWDPVDELAAVQAAMAQLRARHDALCDMFLTPGAAGTFEGRTHVVEVVATSRRTFDRRRLPATILHDDRYYALSTCRDIRLIPKSPASVEDDAVVEPFH